MTVIPTSVTPAFPVNPTNMPALPSLSLSSSELDLIKALQMQRMADRQPIELEQKFYEGTFLVPNLRVAIPDELWNRLRILVGWARVAVDPYVERLSCEGFRLPGGTDVDQRLGEIWDGNGLASEQALAYTDALSMRRAYWMVGSDPDGSDLPRITAESPLNMLPAGNENSESVVNLAPSRSEATFSSTKAPLASRERSSPSNNETIGSSFRRRSSLATTDEVSPGGKAPSAAASGATPLPPAAISRSRRPPESAKRFGSSPMRQVPTGW